MRKTAATAARCAAGSRRQKEFVFYNHGDGQYDVGGFPRALELVGPARPRERHSWSVTTRGTASGSGVFTTSARACCSAFACAISIADTG